MLSATGTTASAHEAATEATGIIDSAKVDPLVPEKTA